MSYLDELSPIQRKAVEHIEGPLMIIAGAGSGKTRVLTYRIAHLIRNGIDPFNILALTFTNKASKEMRERIHKIAGSESANVWMGTFHSVFARILRMNADKIGFDKNFTIYDTQDSQSLIKDIVKQFNLDDKRYKASNVSYRISAAKNKLIGALDYPKSPFAVDDMNSGFTEIQNIFKEYSIRCRRASVMDFDDLLYNTFVLFKTNTEVLNKFQNIFKFILVDEYQDTNFAQYIIIKMLSEKHSNICVVGDDAQSIYNFRGADIRNILNFENDFPNFKQYKLEENYRSTSNIVESSNCIIKENKVQIPKNLFTQRNEGEKITIKECNTDNEEADYIAYRIEKIKKNLNTSYLNFAVFYRTNAQSRPLEEAFRKRKIPYKIFGGMSFYDRKEIKDLMAYFKFSMNLNDEESFKRILNTPSRGIGQTTQDKIMVTANQNGIKIAELLENSIEHLKDLNTNTWSKIDTFWNMIKSFHFQLEKLDAYQLAYEIAKRSGILEFYYQDKTIEGFARYENIKELLNGIKEYTEDAKKNNAPYNLSSFVNEISLLTRENTPNDIIEYVSVMTVHSAKGLEFDYVFVSGMEEGLFPNEMSKNSREEIEEERRLFYVAITRAKEKLYLSYSLTRFRWGNLVSSECSRFVNEINEKFLYFETENKEPQKTQAQELFNYYHANSSLKNSKLINSDEKKKITPKNNLTKLSNTTNSNNYKDTSIYKANQKVKHKSFGVGVIKEISKSNGNDIASIEFESGERKIFLKYAELIILS